MELKRPTTPVEWGLIATLVAVALFVLLEALHLPATALMLGAGILIVAAALWCGLAYASATIAKRKGYSFRKYFVLTLVGGLFAVAGVLALPRLAGAPEPRKGLLGDERGIVTVEAALILTLLVVPVALALAKFEKPIVAWISHTAANLETNSKLQAENNRLMTELLARQGEAQPGPSPTPTPTPGATEPTGSEPKPQYVPFDDQGFCPAGYAQMNGVCSLQR